MGIEINGIIFKDIIAIFKKTSMIFVYLCSCTFSLDRLRWNCFIIFGTKICLETILKGAEVNLRFIEGARKK